MQTSAIRKNQLILSQTDKAVYRILYLPQDEEAGSPGYWIPVNSKSNIPKEFLPKDLQEQLMIGTMERVADTGHTASDSELNGKDIARRDKAWLVIGNIVSKEPEIYEPSKRADLLKTVEKATGITMATLYAYLGKYWRGGCVKNALVPDYKNCGGRRTATSLDSRSGRRKRAGENGKALTEEDISNFQYAIRTFYQKGKCSFHQAYDEMLKERYVRPRFKGDPTPVTMDADEKPSFSQFYYWHHTHGDDVADTKEREGENKFNLRHRAITGKTETSLFGPGDSFQLDATIGDFYLVMKSDRSRLVGRPVVVFFKDAYSRMITGMTVTLENSSYAVWQGALLNTVSTKVDFCRQYGIEITEEEWPCHMLPDSITTDNGEFAVKAVDELVSKLGITVENCPPYRGDLKGIIERTFKTFNLHLKPYVPGYVDKDAGQRGAEDYRKNACLDIDTFTAIMIKVVLYYNNHHYLENYNRTEDMRKNRIPAIPLHLWNYGISHMSGALKKVSPDLCMDALLQKGEADVTPQGIRWNGIYYTCDEAVNGEWMEHARISGNFPVPIRYNPFCCRNIYVKGSDGKYLTCSLVDACSQYENSTEEELKAAHEEDLDMKAACTQSEDQAYSDMSRFIETGVNRCRNEKQNGGRIIEALKKHSIDKNREEEKKRVSGETQALMSQDFLKAEKDRTPEEKKPEDEKPKSFHAVDDQIDSLMKEYTEE